MCFYTSSFFASKLVCQKLPVEKNTAQFILAIVCLPLFTTGQNPFCQRPSLLFSLVIVPHLAAPCSRELLLFNSTDRRGSTHTHTTVQFINLAMQHCIPHRNTTVMYQKYVSPTMIVAKGAQTTATTLW